MTRFEWVHRNTNVAADFRYLAYNAATDRVAVLDRRQMALHMLDGSNGEWKATIHLGSEKASVDGIEFDVFHNRILLVKYRPGGVGVYTYSCDSGKSWSMHYYEHPRSSRFILVGPVSHHGFIPGVHVFAQNSTLFLEIRQNLKEAIFTNYEKNPMEALSSEMSREIASVKTLFKDHVHGPWNAIFLPEDRVAISNGAGCGIGVYDKYGSKIKRLWSSSKAPIYGLAFDYKRGRIFYSTPNKVYAIEANGFVPGTFRWNVSNHHFSSQRRKDAILTLAILRSTQLESSWSLIPNELFFIIIEFYSNC